MACLAFSHRFAGTSTRVSRCCVCRMAECVVSFWLVWPLWVASEIGRLRRAVVATGAGISFQSAKTRDRFDPHLVAYCPCARMGNAGPLRIFCFIPGAATRAVHGLKYQMSRTLPQPNCLASASYFADVRTPIMSATKQADEDEDEEICLLCCEPANFFSIGPCGHRCVCSVCTVRYVFQCCDRCRNPGCHALSLCQHANACKGPFMLHVQGRLHVSRCCSMHLLTTLLRTK